MSMDPGPTPSFAALLTPVPSRDERRAPRRGHAARAHVCDRRARMPPRIRAPAPDRGRDGPRVGRCVARGDASSAGRSSPPAACRATPPAPGVGPAAVDEHGGMRRPNPSGGRAWGCAVSIRFFRHLASISCNRGKGAGPASAPTRTGRPDARRRPAEPRFDYLSLPDVRVGVGLVVARDEVKAPDDDLAVGLEGERGALEVLRRRHREAVVAEARVDSAVGPEAGDGPP
jgi:hypothetical protein